MFKNYFKTANRSLTRNRCYTIINMAGLAVGIGGTLTNFRGKMEDDGIKGKLNDGCVPIKMRKSGTIHFSRK